MAGTRLIVVLLLSISVLSDAHHARFKLGERDMAFKRGQLSSLTSSTMKLLPAEEKDVVYTGSGKHLGRLDFQKNQPKVQHIQTSCQGANGYITVMQPGKRGYPLFVCTTDGDHTTCCYKASNSSTDAGPALYGGGEPALLTEDALYTTQSGLKDRDGIYRTSVGTGAKENMTPPSSRSDQQYVKVIKRRDKVYAFYTEKNREENPDVDIISKISRICMSDLGGSKDILQFQWTSQLSGRLSCGDPSRKLYYTELLDVAVLPSAHGEVDTVYGLFRNGWEMTAVCAYTMDAIDDIFSSFSTKAVEGRIPGECVEDSIRLPANLLRYMETNSDSPTGSSTPLLVSHRHYNHIQVDRVGGTKGQEEHNVLLLSMESGAVHKVLENGSNPFIIAEYHPFKPGTRILSMLLDRSGKKLYVSSSAEVVQIDLRNCSVYQDQCEDCVLARDPYCGWDHDLEKCSTYSQDTIQDVENGEFRKCVEGDGKKDDVDTVDISKSSRHYLACPVQSHHAEYSWLQDGKERWSLMDKEQGQLVLLIEDMGLGDEGHYRCVSTEGDYNKTVAQYSLRISSGGQGLSSHPLTLALLMLLALFLS